MGNTNPARKVRKSYTQKGLTGEGLTAKDGGEARALRVYPAPGRVRRGREYVGWQHARPPAGAIAEIADGHHTGQNYNAGEHCGAGPADAKLRGLAAQDACPAHILGESRPAAIFLNWLAGCVARPHEALGPGLLGLLVQSQSAGVTANDALAEDSARKQTKTLLLQRHKMARTDLGDRRDVFERYAAGNPLHAQVFTKIPHRRTIKNNVEANGFSKFTINPLQKPVKEILMCFQVPLALGSLLGNSPFQFGKPGKEGPVF